MYFLFNFYRIELIILFVSRENEYCLENGYETFKFEDTSMKNKARELSATII